jgi:hypothetical protein
MNGEQTTFGMRQALPINVLTKYYFVELRKATKDLQQNTC